MTFVHSLPHLFGLLSLVIATLFMTIPMIKNRHKYPTVSNLALAKGYVWKFKIGLFLVPICQIVFLFSVAARLGGSSFYLVAILFALGSLGMMGMSEFTLKFHNKIHIVCAHLYFLGTTLAVLLLVGLTITTNPVLAYSSIAVIGLFIYFSEHHLKEWDKVYEIELTHVLLSYPWVIVLTVFLL